MSEKKPKTLEDLPQFFVHEVRKDSPALGWTLLAGKLTGAIRSQDPRCWLVWPRTADGIMGDLTFDATDPGLALFTTPAELPPVSGDGPLAILPGAWQLYHLWIAFSPSHVWRHVEFLPSDAEARPFEGNGKSLDGPPEAGRFIQIRKAGTQSGRSRFVPEPPGGFPANSPFHGYPSIVKGGWDHEHCEYCHEHIDPQDMAHVNRDDDWVCEGCFNKYVLTHDLSFIDEL